MAGLVSSYPRTINPTHSSHSNLSLPTIDQWQVQYARFVIYDTTVEHPSLEHVSKKHLRATGGGAWISTATSASLKVISQPSSARSNEPVLIVDSVRGHVFLLWLEFGASAVEEHLISRMHFSWPQVSCVAGFPPRGTKAVLVSYKDCSGKIQKFALRFSDVVEAEKFMNVLKELLTNASPQPQLQASEFSSEMSSQAEYMPSNDTVYRPIDDSLSTGPVDYGSQLMLPFSEHNTAHCFTSHVHEVATPLATLPPTFTQLLKNCVPEVEAKPTEFMGDIQTQFARFLREASFTELLSAVENVLKEAGDDFVL